MYQVSRDCDWKALKNTAGDDNITFKEDKYHYHCTQIPLVGHLVDNGVIEPDPKQVPPL